MEQPAPTIQFGEEIQPVRTTASRVFVIDNVPSRVRDAASLDNEEKALQIANEDLNRKKKQTYTGWTLAWLAYQSTGVIYGDIGTSPLYVYSSTFTTQPSWDDLVGALSIIIWTLTLLVSIKYVFIVLAADDDGEGGTFALYSLLARYANIVEKDPNHPPTVKMERYVTGEMKPAGKGVRRFIENSRAAKLVLKILGVVGVSMVIADGVLTPAQSVLGAVQGLKVVDDTLTSATIVGVTCAILVILFLAQPFGTTKLASSFAPIVIVWLLFNLCSGIYNIALYDHTVLKAFSPYFAGKFFLRNKEEGWRALGGLLLAFTGVEALFADVGAFSKRAIQLSWLFFAFPCLLMAYIGQAAFIAQDKTGTAFANPFFNTVPPGSFYFSLVIAILAAIVASQALITASFQLLSQVMKLSYFPHIKTVHTSKVFHGQVYMPFANWLLMIGCVVVTAAYSNTTRLGNAYGVCVIVVTFITTIFITLVALVIWRWNILLVILFFLVFGTLDGVYMSSALTKVPHGAWFTILLSGIISVIFILWRYGKENQWAAEGKDNLQPRHLLTTTSSTPSRASTSSPAGNNAGIQEKAIEGQEMRLVPAFGGGVISTVSGIGIFFDKTGHPTNLPIVFTQFMRKFHARPQIIIFFHMRPLPLPSIPEAERYVIQRTPSIPSCYRLTIRHGYMDNIVTPDLGRLITEQLILFITRDPASLPLPTATLTTTTATEGHPNPTANTHTRSSTSAKSTKSIQSIIPHTPEIQSELSKITTASEAQTVYVMGKEQMRIKKHGTNFVRRGLLWAFLWIRENSRAKMADLDVPFDNLVEVGFAKEI